MWPELKLIFVAIGIVLLIAGLNYIVKKRRSKKVKASVLDDFQKPNPLVLKESKERIDKLFSQLGFFRDTYTQFFGEDRELAGKGYMYALMNITEKGYKIIVIFYPNSNYNLVRMSYDRNTPWYLIEEIKDEIAKFYEFDGEFHNKGSGYPSIVWDPNLNFNLDFLKQDLFDAAQKNSFWEEIF